MSDEKRFYLYSRINSAADGSGYSFFIDGSFLQQGQKVKIVIIKRAKAHKRVDMGQFFFDYRTFRALLTIAERTVKTNGGNFSKSYYGGTDGKRKIIVEVKDGTIFFNCYDNVIKTEHNDYKNYTGKLMFSVKGAFDLQELFDIRTTLSNWEISNITRLLKVQNDPKKTEASK